MGMITERSDVKECFIREWAKFVLAIIASGKKSAKLPIKTILADFNDAGTTVR